MGSDLYNLAGRPPTGLCHRIATGTGPNRLKSVVHAFRRLFLQRLARVAVEVHRHRDRTMAGPELRNLRMAARSQ